MVSVEGRCTFPGDCGVLGRQEASVALAKHLAPVPGWSAVSLLLCQG